LANQKPIENKVLAVLYQLSFMKSDSFQELWAADRHIFNYWSV
jgi:hypothetical protein